jgi:hypothetical protein
MLNAGERFTLRPTLYGIDGGIGIFPITSFEKPFILSGDEIIPMDYAGEMIMFGKPYSKMIQAYQKNI